MLVVRIIRWKLVPANWTSVVQFQPWKNAVFVKKMLARHLLGHISDLKKLLADGTLRILRSKQFICDLNIRKRFYGFLCGRRGAVAVGIVLSELLNELFKARTYEIIPKVAYWTFATLHDDLNVGSIVQ